MEVRPGDILARIVSLRRGQLFDSSGPPAATPMALVANSPKLTLAQNRIQARFKIFLSFTRQLVSLDWQCPFNGLNPAEQLLDVFPRLCGIFTPVRFDGHPLPERFLDRMIGTVKWIRSSSRRQNSPVPGKKMFESQIHAKLPLARRCAVIILQPAANYFQRLRLLRPLQRFALERPQVPLRIHNVG